jgi:hypothetical protein
LKQPTAEKQWARSACPRCGKSAPLKLIIGGRGKAFECESCHAILSVSKLSLASFVPIALLGAFTVKSLEIPFIVVMLLVLAAAIVEWAMLKVYLSDE